MSKTFVVELDACRAFHFLGGEWINIEPHVVRMCLADGTLEERDEPCLSL